MFPAAFHNRHAFILSTKSQTIQRKSECNNWMQFQCWITHLCLWLDFLRLDYVRHKLKRNFLARNCWRVITIKCFRAYSSWTTFHCAYQRNDKKLHITTNMLSSVSFVFWCLVKLEIAWRGSPLWRAIAIFPYCIW